MAREPGSWAPCPNIETAVGPSVDGTDGVMLVDGAIIPGGVPDEPVCVTIKEGKVCTIEGGQAADRLDEWLRSFKDPNVYQVVEFGIGLNRMARIGRGLMAEDESQFGTIHLGLGEGQTFGLPIDAPTHVDLVIRNPDVYIDGEIVVHSERLVGAFEIEDLKEARDV
jgi:leucyl aminopeptidase (aminopeptidase T)